MTDQTPQKAVGLFDAGLYCAESVLMAMAESRGIESPLIPKIATGFCSGVARTCGMCGAVSGAIMGVSLVSGRSLPTSSVESCYALTQKLVRQFEQRFGSTNCRQLIDCDLDTEQGQLKYEEEHLRERCQSYVEEATRIAMSLLQNSPPIA